MDSIFLGIDTGGTFTDFVLVCRDGTLRKWKVLSTPSDPSRAIVQGIRDILGSPSAQRMEVVHGTTVGTNAFLERKGAKTCLVTTRGFEDILFVGRQARPSLYDLMVKRPKEIIGREMVFGIDERCTSSGRVLRSPSDQDMEEAVGFCKEKAVESVAVCLLHSYANPENEEKIG